MKNYALENYKAMSDAERQNVNECVYANVTNALVWLGRSTLEEIDTRDTRDTSRRSTAVYDLAQAVASCRRAYAAQASWEQTLNDFFADAEPEATHYAEPTSGSHMYDHVR